MGMQLVMEAHASCHEMSKGLIKYHDIACALRSWEGRSSSRCFYFPHLQ